MTLLSIYSEEKLQEMMKATGFSRKFLEPMFSAQEERFYLDDDGNEVWWDDWTEEQQSSFRQKRAIKKIVCYIKLDHVRSFNEITDTDCRFCGHHKAYILYHYHKPKYPHFAEFRCAKCGRNLKWVNKHERQQLMQAHNIEWTSPEYPNKQ